jgi:hypothetical protein
VAFPYPYRRVQLDYQLKDGHPLFLLSFLADIIPGAVKSFISFAGIFFREFNLSQKDGQQDRGG